MMQPVRFSRALLLSAISATILLSAAPAQAQTQPQGYIPGKPLGFTLPPAPSQPGAVELELTIIRAAQADLTPAANDEAIVDARAYGPDLLITRFSDAAQAPLSSATRPFLLRLLNRALPEVSGYSEAYKKIAERPRPYVEDKAIRLCYDNPQHALDPQRAYPSGHAANGYAAALLLAEVIPARRQQILARGIRYGTNRVACGAHHPSDVLQGQLLAIQYFESVRNEPAFRQDLDCARRENAIAEGDKTPLPQACTKP